MDQANKETRDRLNRDATRARQDADACRDAAQSSISRRHFVAASHELARAAEYEATYQALLHAAYMVDVEVSA